MERIPPLPDPAAPPRQAGEPIFQAPWEARAFALVLQLHAGGRFSWDDFRDRLIAEIAAGETANPATPSGERYYERWLASLERLLAEQGLISPEERAARLSELQPAPGRPPAHGSQAERQPSK